MGKERNPYHKPAGSPQGGEFTSGQFENAVNRGAGLNSYDNLSRDLLDRSSDVFHEFTDGEVSTYIDRQMRGGKLTDNGKFTPFTPSSKLADLRKTWDLLQDIRDKDPEAYDWAIKMSLADAIGGPKQLWTEISEMVDVYRGDIPYAKLPAMTNVSLSRDVASEWGQVVHYRMSKNSDYYVNYASRFGEAEIFIFDTKTLERVND